MNGILLTQNTTPIFRYIVWVLGKIMEGIFNVIDMIGIPNVGLAIIIFTIVINLLMLPLTIKQQKYSKLSAKMNPEIQAIQAKYKNRKDQDSQLAMNQEIQGVYAKYGVSATGTCGYFLIQMPILIALYRVIYAMPAYVGKIGDTFRVLASKIIATDNAAWLQNPNFAEFATASNPVENIEATSKIMNTVAMYGKSITNGNLSNGIVDVLNKLSSSDMTLVAEHYGLNNLTYPEQGGKLILGANGLIEKYNYFLGLNMGDSPSTMIHSAFQGGIGAAFSNGMWLIALGAIMIPVLSVVTQWVSVKLMPQPDTKNMDEQQLQMQSTMKSMNLVMPLMSAWFCYTLPAGMGLYWVAGSVVRSIQQVAINKHIDKMDINEIIEKNAEKSAKKMEKLRENQERINAYANMNTRNMKGIQQKANNPSGASESSDNTGYTHVNSNAKPGSMMSKANKVSEFNKKNTK